MYAKKLAVLALGSLSLAALSGCNESEAGDRRSAQAGTPREVCTEETIERKKPAKDDDRVIGTVAGAVVGGVVGDKIGGDLATVGGAVAGGYAGNRVQKSVQKGKTEEVTKRVCRTVYD